MKVTLKVVTTLTAVLLASILQSTAIEGLQLSVQCTNVVLTWPSVEGETYIIQARTDIGTNGAWVFLTNSYPAASGTNMTCFVHTNVVAHPVCGPQTGGGGGSGG